MLKIDGFLRNILVVFTGASLANFLNLLYQLLIAHRLTPDDFASINTLLAVFGIVSAPLNVLQLSVSRQCAEFKARAQMETLTTWLSCLISRHVIFAAATAFLFWLFSLKVLSALNISSPASGLIFVGLLVTMWFTPVVTGAVQGVESFRWFSAGSVVSAIGKIVFALLFLSAGLAVPGALGAFLLSQIALIVMYGIPLRQYIHFPTRQSTSYRELLLCSLPFAVSALCFMTLVSSDMILVKLFFPPDQAGYYSIAQMIGKIVLFLPGAVTMVMFPRTSSLNAQQKDTAPVVRRSLGYVFAMCVAVLIVYNSVPGLILKVLTGKAFPESILLGRLFGISMSFYTLGYVFIAYFLSVRDWRYLPWMTVATAVQVAAVSVYHPSITHVQVVVCAVSVMLFAVLAWLGVRTKGSA